MSGVQVLSVEGEGAMSDPSPEERIASLERLLETQKAFHEFYKNRLYQRDEQVGQLYAALERAHAVIEDAMRYHVEDALAMKARP
jgi:hypothetical protein